jgi:hypothetical protein
MLRSMISAALLLAATGTACLVSVSPVAAQPAASTVSRSAAVVQHGSALSPYPLRCVVNGSNVNYRRGPGTQYASYGQLRREFVFSSGGEVVNPRSPHSHYEYWDTIQRPGHADAYVDDVYVSCTLAPNA